jgi:hypothetical protein
MTKILALALVAAAALPARADDFGAANLSDLSRQAASVPVPASSRPDGTLDPETVPVARRRELISRSSEWRARKEDMRAALNEFYDTLAPKNGFPPELEKCVKRMWAEAKKIETVQDIIAERFSARVAAEEKDPAERDRRLSAIATVREFRKFAVYGHYLPTWIDENHQNDRGLYDGRTYAGSTWGMALTKEEMQATNNTITPLTGFSNDEYRDAEKRAEAELK